MSLTSHKWWWLFSVILLKLCKSFCFSSYETKAEDIAPLVKLFKSSIVKLSAVAIS